MFIAKDLPVVAWNRLHLPAAPQKRGRPRNNNGYFTKYHKKAKKSRTHFEALDPLDEEEMILREEAEHLKAAIREEEDQDVTTQDSIHCTSQDVVLTPVKVNFTIFSTNVKVTINNFFSFLEYPSVYT